MATFRTLEDKTTSRDMYLIQHLILFTNFNVLLKNASSKHEKNKKTHPLITIKITLTFDCYIRLFVYLTVVNKQITQII